MIEQIERPQRRLPACTFYGVIVAGLVLGIAASVGGALAYVKAGDRRPDGRRIWGDVADSLVLPIAVMVGGTFGGLAGFAAAVLMEKANGRRKPAG